MYRHLGTFVVRHSLLVVLLWVALLAGLRVAAPSWNDVTWDGDLAYLPTSMPSVTGQTMLRHAFPDAEARSQIVFILVRRDGTLTEEDLGIADELAKRFDPKSGDKALTDQLPILEVWSRSTPVVGSKLISRDRRAVLVSLQIQNEFMATDNMRVLSLVSKELGKFRKKLPPGLQLGITGSAAVGGDMRSAAAESIKNTEFTTVVMVLGILLLVYRAPLLVIVPLITIVVSVAVSTSALAALTQLYQVPGFGWWNFKVFTTTRIFIIVILFGAGTDFCLFLIARYREELKRGLRRDDAIVQSLAQVGDALLASALTTIVGLSMMFFADFGKFTNSGPAIGLCLVVTLLACLTLAPALLKLSGRLAFWPYQVDVSDAPADSHEAKSSQFGWSYKIWEAVGRLVVSHPGLVLVLAVIAMLPLAAMGLSVDITYDLLSELQSNRPSVRGTRLFEQHFSPGDMAPLTVLAVRDDGSFGTDAGEQDIARLTRILFEMKDVQSVRSITEPLGDKPGFVQPFSRAGRLKLLARKHRLTKARFVTQIPELKGNVARFDLVLPYPPFSAEAIGLLDKIEAQLSQLSGEKGTRWEKTRFEVAGTTPAIRDLKDVTASDQTRIRLLVVIAVLAVIMLILRSPKVCIYLIASVLFSYFVTMGITELFFQWSYGDTYHGLDWKVPIFLFVILVAVGQDYNIYLVTRVFEEQSRLGPIQGLRAAVVHTGGTITSCGLIMAATFVSMMSGSLRGMHELGFALSIGILLDTFVIRTVLVPAFLGLLARQGVSVSAPIVSESSHQAKIPRERVPTS